MKNGLVRIALPAMFIGSLALAQVLISNMAQLHSPRPAEIYANEDPPPLIPQPLPEEEFIPELDSPKYTPPKPVSQNNPLEFNLKIYGGNDFSFKFGKSFFVSDKDRLNALNDASTPAFASGFVPNMDLKFNATGNIGNEVNMNIDFDQREILGNNLIFVTYKPIDDQSFLKELSAGNMEFDFGNSRLISFKKDRFKGLGLDTQFAIGKFHFRAMGALSESQKETEIFEGQRKRHSIRIEEYRFAARQYYQLEPFFYYDNLSSPPANISAVNYKRGDPSSLNIFTSKTPVISSPPVNVDPGSLEIFLDTGNNQKNHLKRASPVSLNGNHVGNFYRLREGKDYIFNYRTARLKFIQSLPVEARVLVRYTRNHGTTSTSDPSARIENGKIETFIKFGAFMNEDSRLDGVNSFTGSDDVEIIRDGVVNLDVYEVRGIYDLHGIDIEQGGFSLKLISNGLKDVPGIDSLGYYTVNFQEGILEFQTREPFKNLQSSGNYIYGDSDIREIYSETQGSYIYDASKVQIQSDFTARLRTFQLKHINIVPGSELVKVNGMSIAKNQYFIDYQSGYFVFLSPSQTMVNHLSRIEISYSYIPFGNMRESFLIGSRIEYKPLEEFALGANAYYNGDFQPVAIEYVGREPQGLFITGVDANLKVNENSMTSLANKILKSNYANVPVEFYAYGEYAHSFHNINTMGNALIDNMETSQEFLDVNLNSNIWTLSSLPPSVGLNQCNRAPLYYKYYYDPAHFEYGLLPYTSTPTAAPDYATMAGPYNVSYGHLSDQQLIIQNNQRQVSLVMDFDYALAPDPSLPFIGIQTQLTNTASDLSGYSQIEFDVLLENSANLDSGILLNLDIGTVNEDSDGNGQLSTEDIGLDHVDGDTNSNGIQDATETWDTGERNHILDFNRYTGETEDIGYPFNPPSCSLAATKVGGGPAISGYPATIGNGQLNSEDTNDNGQLDTTDNVISIDPSNPAIQYESGSNLILPGGWRHIKIFINPELLTDREKAILRRAESIRVYSIGQGAAQSGKGKIFIDQLRLTGSQWKTKKEKLFGSAESGLSDPGVLKVTNIDNFSSKEEYESESFLLKKRDEYELLYGKKSNTEIYTIKEGSLKLEYNLTSLHEYAYVQKTIREAMDISSYKKINIWVNHRSYSSNTTKLFLRIGSDESNYLEFENPIQSQDWQKIEFDLNSPTRVNGNPIRKLVKYLSVGIQNTTPGSNVNGISWIDDIYVSDPDIKSDYAYTYGTGFSISKPLFVLKDGVPVLSNLKADYYKKFRNYDFRSIGETSPTLLENEDNVRIQSRIFPFWSFDYSMSDFKSDASKIYILSSDNYQGIFSHTQHRTQQEFFSNTQYAPHLAMGLTYDKEFHEVPDVPNILYGSSTRDIKTDKYMPELNLSQETPLFLKILKIHYNIKASSTFIKRDSSERVTDSSGITIFQESLNEKEQWENNLESVTIFIGNFSLKSAHNHNQSLLLQRNLTNNIISQPVSGDFYFPFFDQPLDARLQQRFNGFNFEANFNKLWFFSPRINVNVLYNEDSFRDNPQRVGDDIYQRLKNSSSLTGFTITIPFLMTGKIAGNLKGEKQNSNDDTGNSIVLSFHREFKLQEFGVPFTSQSSILNDDFGIQRVFPELSQGTFDLVQYPFWYYFLSPANSGSAFYNGRQFVGEHNLGISSQSDPGAADSYTNNLWLKEIVNLNTRWLILNGVTFIADSRLSQDVSRLSVYSGLLQEGDFSYSLQFLLNLMKFLNEGFWNNKSNNSTLTLGFQHKIHMYIISNVEETILKPDAALEFKWTDPGNNTLNGFTIHITTGFHSFKSQQYLTDQGFDPALESQVDTIESLYSIQKLINYNISINMFTEIPLLKKTLESLLKNKIEHNPKYSITIGADINRHEINFYNIIQAALLDEFTMKHSLDMNLHKNVTGILDFTLVYDIRRNPDDNHIMQEIFSLQAGISAKILF